MHRQDTETQSTAADTILALISNEKNQDRTIEYIFESNPDAFFADDNAKRFFTAARTAGKTTTLNSLLFLLRKYLADKTEVKEWNKLANTVLSMVYYYAAFEEYVTAKGMMEYALFYFEKLAEAGQRIDASKKLILQKELADYCIQYFNSLKFEDSDTPLENLHNAKKTLQQLHSILIKIRAKTKLTEDQGLIELYGYKNALLHKLIAERYHNQALSEAIGLTNDPETDSATNLQVRIEAERKYRLALLHSELAKETLQDLLAATMVSTENQANSNQLLQQLAQMIEALHHGNNVLAAQLTYEPMIKQLRTNKFCALVSDRNTTQAQAHFFLETFEIDVNTSDDYSLCPIDQVTASGNPSVLNLLIKGSPAKISFLPTEDRNGLMDFINEYSLPEVVRYLLDPTRSFYIDKPQHFLLEFYLDVMAGRLNKTIEHLREYPNIIIATPASCVPNETAIELFILEVAYEYDQRHIVAYLENYIAKQVNQCITIDNANHLKTLHNKMFNCYVKVGLNKQRREMVEAIANRTIGIYNHEIARLQNIPAQEGLIRNYQCSILEILQIEASKFEISGDRSINNKVSFYQKSYALLQKISKGMMEMGATRVDLFATIVRLEQKLQRSAPANVSLAPMQVGEEKDEQKDSAEQKAIAPVFLTHVSGSFNTSSNMFTGIFNTFPGTTEHPAPSIFDLSMEYGARSTMGG